jgi:hypothetical protein
MLFVWNIICFRIKSSFSQILQIQFNSQRITCHFKLSILWTRLKSLVFKRSWLHPVLTDGWDQFQQSTLKFCVNRESWLCYPWNKEFRKSLLAIIRSVLNHPQIGIINILFRCRHILEIDQSNLEFKSNQWSACPKPILKHVDISGIRKRKNIWKTKIMSLQRTARART